MLDQRAKGLQAWFVVRKHIWCVVEWWTGGWHSPEEKGCVGPAVALLVPPHLRGCCGEAKLGFLSLLGASGINPLSCP